jgi:hypothetical protein
MWAKTSRFGIAGLVGLLLLAGCGGSHGLSSSSTCLEWGSASTKERNAFAPGSVPSETVTEHQGGQNEKLFGPYTHETESEPARQITHECEAEISTGAGPKTIGEAR